MNKNTIKIALIIEILVLLGLYVNSIWGINHLFLMIVGFYPALRIMVDLVLIIFSLIDDDWMRRFVHNKTKGKVPYHRSWSDRFVGIQFWAFALLLVYVFSIFF